MFISIVVCSQIKALYLFLNSIFLDKSYVGTGIAVNCLESKFIVIYMIFCIYKFKVGQGRAGESTFNACQVWKMLHVYVYTIY